MSIGKTETGNTHNRREDAEGRRQMQHCLTNSCWGQCTHFKRGL